MGQETIYFCMPLVGRSSAKDWNRVCQLLDQTLKSILSQRGNIRVLIACNEVPRSTFALDYRVTLLSIESDRPRSWQDMLADKRKKLRELVCAVCERGGGYIVPMDADDLISSRIAAYIHESDNKMGYLFQSGYILNVAGAQFRLTHDFPTHCGSCAAFYLGAKDLTPGEGVCAIIEGGVHSSFELDSKKIGRGLRKLPFPAAIYVRHHGENVSCIGRSRFKMTRSRDFLRRLLPVGYLTDQIRAEFSVPAHY